MNERASKEPLAAGAVTFLVVLFVWGSLDQVSVWHDEAAYLLQARIFASMRWAAEARPLPEFFEQYHVLVTPVLAAKYHPGHALLLAAGALLGLPGLVPALMSALAGALVFALARRLATPGVAWLTWGLWLPTIDNLRFRASYMSEVTTSLAVLAAWWGFMEWRRSGLGRWLGLTAAVIGWGAITRPLTMAALGLPIVVAVLIVGVRKRAFSQLAVSGSVGLAVLALLPLWNHGTLGVWSESPRELYTSQYMPWDRPGFGLDSTPPSLDVSPDMVGFSETYLAAHAAHVPSALPGAFLARVVSVGSDVWGRWRVVLLPAVVLGLMGLGGEALFAVGSALLLFLAYLPYEHDPHWTIYYLEILPVLAFMTALGLARAATWLERMPAMVRDPLAFDRIRKGLFAALALLSLFDVTVAETRVQGSQRQPRLLRDAIAELGVRPSILFVRYGPNHVADEGLILNEPDLALAPVILAHDRGSENVKLARLFQGRTLFLLETVGGDDGPEQWRFYPMEPAGAPGP